MDNKLFEYFEEWYESRQNPLQELDKTQWVAQKQHNERCRQYRNQFREGRKFRRMTSFEKSQWKKFQKGSSLRMNSILEEGQKKCKAALKKVDREFKDKRPQLGDSDVHQD